MVQTARLEEKEAISEALLACPIQSPVELQVLAGSHIYRLRSRLIGIDTPHCLLLKHGIDQSWLDAKHVLKQGQPVILRMVNEIGHCQLLAFRTQLGLSYKSSPTRRWLSVDYPALIESANMRQQKRIRLKMSCYIEFGEGQRSLALGMITDLSTNGCRIVTNLSEPLENGTTIRIHFKGDYDYLSLPGIVRNATAGANNSIIHGIQFGELDQMERGGLSEVMLANY